MEQNNMNNQLDMEEITKERNRKKALVPMFIAIFTLVALTVGATYAYIQVATTNSFGNPKITGTVPSIGSVTMSAGTSLTLTTTRPQMMQGSNDLVYYATSSGISTTSNGMQTIGTATVTGAGTFTCNYTLNVKATGELLSLSKGLGTGLVTLEVTHGTNNTQTQTYDFNSDLTASILSTNGANLSGSFTGLTSSASKSIQARFKLTNSKTVNQSVLNGKSGTVTFTLSGLSCTATG